MKKIIEAMEDKAVRSYGFEARKTITVFKATEMLRKAFKIEY